ncbi:MAG: hypothetical protein ACYSWO_04315 [Planctomycetota bacterium]|jgi:hypothetical protein
MRLTSIDESIIGHFTGWSRYFIETILNQLSQDTFYFVPGHVSAPAELAYAAK